MFRDNTVLFKFGQFRDPHYIAIDSSDQIYVTDSGDDCGGIYVFNDCGILITQTPYWGEP